MRSAVQSCVPLQESTAKRCAFLCGIDSPAKRDWRSVQAHVSLLTNGPERHTNNERSECLSMHEVKKQCSPPSFLGYHATGHNGLEGALRATETSCAPLLENQALTKVSWVLFSCPWTPKIFFEGKKDKISTSSHSTDTPTLNKKHRKGCIHITFSTTF